MLDGENVSAINQVVGMIILASNAYIVGSSVGERYFNSFNPISG